MFTYYHTLVYHSTVYNSPSLFTLKSLFRYFSFQFSSGRFHLLYIGYPPHSIQFIYIYHFPSIFISVIVYSPFIFATLSPELLNIFWAGSCKDLSPCITTALILHYHFNIIIMYLFDSPRLYFFLFRSIWTSFITIHFESKPATIVKKFYIFGIM